MPTALEPTDPPARYVDEIAYTDEGAGPLTVVTVPGLPGSGRDFRWLAPALAGRVRVIRIDPPGYGASRRSRWAGMTIGDRADVVSSVIAHLGLDPVVLVGHSAGGAAVAHLAVHQPSVVSGCVMVSATGPSAHLARRPLQVAAQILRVQFARALLAPGIRRLYSLQGFPRYLSDDERAYALLDAAAFDFAEHQANLAGMRTPTMVAWAQDDPIIPVATFHALAEMVPPGPRLEFPDGGHNVQKAHAQEIADAIVDFAG